MATHVESIDHYHQPGLQHQFEDMKQQEESVSIGMWMFLVQEIMFFGGLFTVYLVFRSRFPIAFATGSNHLDVVMGFVNTLVLIVSSLTMALTVYYAQKSNRNMQVLMIIFTMFFGAVFFSDFFGKGLCLSSGNGQCGDDGGSDESFHCDAMFLVIDRLNDPKLAGGANPGNSA